MQQPLSEPVANEGFVRLSCGVFQIQTPLAPEAVHPWRSVPIFRGATAGVRSWSCHAALLQPQHSPHPPHRHDEEELLMVLDGQVDLELPESGWPANDRRLRLTRGQFVFYPPHFPHTLRAAGDRPASYLMLKWHDGAFSRDSRLAFGRFDAAAPGPLGEARHPWGVRQKIFAGVTPNLGELKCHVSTVPPGAGYEPHADAYDVAIVTLDGEVETLGQRVPPDSVIFYPAGELHGMRNVDGAPARYVVFEFHSTRKDADLRARTRPPLYVRLTDPQRWKRQIRHMLAR